jgi:ATP-dependent Clp endopeptidase proteolytic subunit ClpP
MRPCFAFNLAADDSPSTLSIFDEIGFWGVQAKDFVRDLAAVKGKTLNVEINSPGGDVFAGLAIYNALKGSGKEIVVRVMGVAASAASLIAMAGDKIVMPKNTFLMIHNPWSMAVGNADDLRDTADVLDKIGLSLRATYAKRTGMSDEDLEPLLAKDTWLTADEALEMGFATEVTDEVNAQASFDMARADLPEAVVAVFATARIKAEADAAAIEAEAAAAAAAAAALEAPAPAVEAALADRISALATESGFPEFGSTWAVACASLEAVRERMGAAREIRALCAHAKQPATSADAWIRAGKSIVDVRAELIQSMAVEDEATHTDSTSKTKESAPAAAAGTKATTADIWATHKGRSKGKSK